MTSEENTIMLTSCVWGQGPPGPDRNQYHTLVTLIAAHLSIPGFVLCSGMASFDTCAVEINREYSSIKQF